MRRGSGERPTVSVRLSEEDVRALDELVDATLCSSRGLAAKFVLTTALRGAHPTGELEASLSELFGELESLHDELARMRRSLVDALEVILVNLTPEDPATIRAWVSAKFAPDEVATEER